MLFPRFALIIPTTITMLTFWGQCCFASLDYSSSASTSTALNSINDDDADSDNWIHFIGVESIERSLSQNGIRKTPESAEETGKVEFYASRNGKPDVRIDDGEAEPEHFEIDKIWEGMERNEGRRATLRMLLEEEDIEETLAEINQDWRQRVDEKRRRKIERELDARRRRQSKRMARALSRAGSVLEFGPPKFLGAGYDPEQFRRDVYDNRPCDGEPLQTAEYYLFKYSHKFGIYHTGLLVCGIEIHFHRPGVEYWKPMEYSTRFIGGNYRIYRIIHYQGKPLFTHKSFREIIPIVNQLKSIFRADTYNLITRNCLLFARLLVRSLTGLTNGEKIEWPWSMVHPLKKGYFITKKSFRRNSEKIMEITRSYSQSLRITSRNWSSSFRKNRSMEALPERASIENDEHK